MSDSQKQTIARYQSFTDTIAQATILRTALELKLWDILRSGPKTLVELAEHSGCDLQALDGLVRALVALGVMEQYGDDLALSQAAQLVAGPDADLSQNIWSHLTGFVRSQETALANDAYRRRLIARQWTHTAAAMQAAEVLNIGGSLRGLKVLELGSGAGVWSAAMAYRDSKMHVTAVDQAPYLAHCQATYASIGLDAQWTPVAADYRHWPIPLGQFDLVILPEVLQLESDAAAVILLGRAADALRVGGQVVITESLREADGPTAQLALQALELAVAVGGLQRSAGQIQQLLRGAGLADAQWGWLTASTQGVGLIVSDKRQATV